MESGCVVELVGASPLAGTLLEVVGEQATLELMHEVGRFTTRVVHRSLLRNRLLTPETRAFLQEEDGSWRPWRIGRREGSTYEVIGPDKAMYVEVVKLRVRATEAPSSPLQILAVGAHETPYFSERRWQLVQEIVKLRALSGGLDGLLSAGIELLPHQIAAVQRVLSDPVPRYLLADEVGMGKTIEAGVVIRQYLLDSHGEADAGAVVVVVPPQLVGQWRDELRHRFGVGQFGQRVWVGTLDDIDRCANLEIGLLVVDEAHGLGRFAWIPEGRAQYDALAQLARRAPRALLLSATPASHHEREYLAMLHLLDPAQYRLDGEKEFRQRLSAREALADSMAFLTEDSPPDEVEFGLDGIEEDLDLPPEGRKFVHAAREACGRDSAELNSALRALRVWLSERYRVHRRVIRSRRSQHEAVMPSSRNAEADSEGLLLASLECSVDSRAQNMASLLEGWRERAAAVAEEASEPARTRSIARVYAALLDAASLGPDHLAEAARVRRTADRSVESKLRLGAAVAEALSAIELLDGEADELDAIEQLTRGGDEEWPSERLVATVVARQLRAGADDPGGPSVVVFTTSTYSAGQIATRVEASLGLGSCALHTVDMDASALAESTRRLRDDSVCQVLVCDRSGEEGLNLQFVHRVVLHDLPLDPSRIEQRLGRLDRFGQDTQLVIRILAASWVHEEWANMLCSGFGVLGDSISVCQYAVERETSQLSTELLMSGADALGGASVTRVAEAMARERRAVAAQDMFDAHELDDQESRLAARLAQEDYRTDGFAGAVHAWLHGVLHLRPSALGDSRRVFEYEGLRSWNRVLLPHDQLLELRRLVSGPLTFSRHAASMRPEIGLLRPGHPGIDFLSRRFWLDERGKASVVWRQWDVGEDCDPAPTPVLILRYVLTAGPPRIPESVPTGSSGATLRHAATRLAARLLPPRTVERICYLDGTPVEDVYMRATAASRYEKRADGGMDTNLAGELSDVFLDHVGRATFAGDLHAAAERAEADMMRGGDTRDWIRQGVSAAEAEHERRRAILTARRSVAEERKDVAQLEALGENLAAEELLRAVVETSVEQAHASLDSVAVVILAATPPPLTEEYA